MYEQIQFDYLGVHQLVDDYGLEISPSHLHGIITASACTAGYQSQENNFLELIKPHDETNHCQLELLSDSLNSYYQQVVRVLEGPMFEFEPALPDEDSDSQFRTEELAAWCRGFLTAYHHSIKHDEALGSDAAEALQDLSEIACAETGEGDTEELAQALTELEEYLRISVQLIFDDLNTTQTIH